MQRTAPALPRVQVQSFTYDKSRGVYRLRRWLASTRMDAHVPNMLRRGWKILSAADESHGPSDTITLVFGKVC